MSFGVGLLGASTRRLHIEQRFYEVAAQVIPVFLLVLAVEGRYFRERPTRSQVASFAMETLLYLTVLSETFALAAVARGHDSDLLRGGLLGGLFVLVFGFLLLASSGPVPVTPVDERTAAPDKMAT